MLDELYTAGICSQPTYKEWKLMKADLFHFTILFRSQPTYKEWKPDTQGRIWGADTFVPSLPTRNGNACTGSPRRG